MPVKPSIENARREVGSTPAEGPRPPAPAPVTETAVRPGPTDGLTVEERVARLEANAPEGEPFTADPASIDGHRDAQRDATGYADLVAEVGALEAGVTDSTPHDVREAIVNLRNKTERPPLKQDASNDINSPEVRRGNVARAGAVAADLADRL
jgi:hypothetical protein